MKKIVLILLALVVSFNNAYSQKKGRGKIIAAADAAGALGGAGSVASIASWFSWTPAAPVAGIALCVGAVIGGVGASCAVSRQAPPTTPKDALTGNVLLNSNYVDQVGVLHNEILFDYFNQNKDYSPEAYYEFIKNNKSKYGISENPISLDYLIKQYESSIKFSDITGVNSYIIENLPENVSKVEYSNFLKELDNITEKNQSIDFIKKFEENELKNSKYDDKTKIILGSFFSTYRHSLSLWY